MPPWLRERILTLLPRVFERYGAATGVPLSFVPTVFMSYGKQERPRSYSYGGGTLPRVMQLEVRLGSAYAGERDAEVQERASLLVAHEAAHFWNAHMFHHEAKEGDWMHEGGADAFARRALVGVGEMTPARLAAIEDEEIGKCLLGAPLGPIHDAAPVGGRYKLLYWCGTAFARMTELAAAAARPPRDLFAFWGDVFRRANGDRYEESTYFDALAALGPGGAAAAETIRAVLADAGADRAKAILDALPDLTASPAGAAPSEEYERFAGRVAATLLLRAPCGRDIALDADKDALSIVDAPKTCPAWSGASLVALEGEPLVRRGAEAWDSATRACARAGPVDASTRRDGKEPRVSVACPPRWDPRPSPVHRAVTAPVSAAPKR